MAQGKIYVSVILPIKFEGEIFYILPHDSYSSLSDSSATSSSKIFSSLTGSRVRVMFGKKIHSGVIRRVVEEKDLPQQFTEVKVKDEKTGTTRTELKPVEYKEILYIEDLPKITPEEIKFWDSIAHYYLCSTGEVFKAAYPILTQKQEAVKSHKTPADIFEKIKKEDNENQFSFIDAHRPVLSDAQQIAYKQIKEQIAKKPVLLEGGNGKRKKQKFT